MASKAGHRTAPLAPVADAEPHGMLACVPWRVLEDQAAAWDRLALDVAVRFEQGGRLAGLLPVVRAGRYHRWPVGRERDYQLITALNNDISLPESLHYG